MRYAYNNGAPVATPRMLSYQIGEAMANAGVPVLVGGAGNEGLALASTTAAADLVGVTVDKQDTLLTAQQSENADPARKVRVIVNPNAVYAAKLSGGATADTALSEQTVSTGSTDGLTVTTGAAWNSPTFDEGAVWGFEGANSGIGRKITSVSATAGTVTVAFPNDIAVGDKFLRAPYCASPIGMENQFVQLTSDLAQLNAAVAVDSDNNNFRVVELQLLDKADDGANKSFGLIVPFDSIFAAGGSV